MFLTGRRLLEWETAAEASLRTRGATDLYLEWSPVIAVGITALLGLVRPDVAAGGRPAPSDVGVGRAGSRTG